MEENKQNTETNSATVGAASVKQAKDESSTANQANEQNKSPKDSAKQNNQSSGETFNKVKETVASAAGQVAEPVKEKAGSVIDEQKSNLASGVASVADSIRQVGENLGGSEENNQIAAFAGKYGDTLAQQVERVSDYIDERELKEIVQDVQQFARRNPVLFVGGAFALGILAARFLKSSGKSSRSNRTNSNA